MVQVGRRRHQARRQSVRDRDRQSVDGGAVDHRGRAYRNPRAGGRGWGERAPRGRAAATAASAQPRAAEALSKPAPSSAAAPASRPPPMTAPGAAAQPAAAAPGKLDPFFEVRTPQRNYGPARLAGG